MISKEILVSSALTLSSLSTAAWAELNVKVSGFYTSTYAYTHVSPRSGVNEDFSGFDIKTSAEIHFKPSLVLDNGVKLGAEIQLEAESETSFDQIDESFFTVSGDFGRLIIGSENSAGYLQTVRAPNAAHIFFVTSAIDDFVPYFGVDSPADFFRTSLGTTLIENNRNNDANRITYFSPRIKGFEFGLSYARDEGQGNGVQQASFRPVAAGVIRTNATDIVDLSFNYKGAIGALDVRSSARYGTANITSNIPAAGLDTPEIWGIGLSLGYAGFTLGGSFVEQNGTTVHDGNAYDIGLSYRHGKWTHSINHFRGKNSDEDVLYTSSERINTTTLASRYKLHKNFSVSAFISQTDFSEEFDPAGIGAEDVEATVIGVSASLRF
ncbi:porin [Amylibacter sp. SFDW26]|uniref:porin n=1 Tax=Amylibacter sp. SFDW26 TaxID=2652722 RepID=UPI001262AA45|nr:porin [Amylibacter sp. SFDW26]KAB7616260.1 porin [Amylibacter sp. SFDW26]